MKKFIAPLVFTVGLAFATPALAKNSKSFENTFATPVDSVRIEVVLSEEMMWRANNLPKDRRDRGSIRNSRDGFGGNGFYGERDLERLVTRLEKKMAARLEKEGVTVSDTSTNVLRITLDDARPTRPTFEQMSKNVSLSRASYGRGGASFAATLIANNGEAQGDISYAWYEQTICDSATASTWSDSNRAIDRFARKTAKSLSFN